jgi:hypothetical protein
MTMEVLNWIAEHWLLTIVLSIILTNGAVNLFRGRE